MGEEVFDVPTQSQAAPETPSEPTPAPEAKAPEVTEQSDVPAEATADVPKQRETRSEKRIRELVAERDRYRQVAELVSQPSAQPGVTPSAGESDENTEFLQTIQRSVAAETGDIRQMLLRQEAERQIDRTRAEFPDFDQYLPEVHEILSGSEELRKSKNAVQMAYFMARGITASQAVDSARDEGRKEAYNTIDQKVNAGVSQPTPKTVSDSGADLLARFQAGKISAEERQAKWPQILQAMAAAREV